MHPSDESPKPRGRPRVEDPGTSVSTWLKSAEHDKLIQLANQREMKVSAVVRQILRQSLR